MPNIALCTSGSCILKDSCRRNPKDYGNISGFQNWACYKEYENDDGIIVCDNYLEKRGINMDNDLSKVQVGDYIWTIYDGWVRVTQVDRKLAYPILVETSAYSTDGMYNPLHKYPSAFVVPPSDFNIAPKPCSFFDGDMVIVSNSQEDWHIRRHFSHIGDDGRFYCYQYGGTRWSSKQITTSWTYCKSADNHNTEDITND